MNRSSRWIHPALVLAAMAAPTRADDAPRAADPSRIVSAALEVFWPGHPEPVDMLADILIKGPRIGGGDGWFRKSAAQSRFSWASTRKGVDANGDGSVSRAEFPGTDADFARLDRDRSGTLTAADFDFSSPDSAPSPAVAFFGLADRDGNGKITREEVDALFRENDGGGLGFLSFDDLRRALTTPPNGSGPPSGPPTRWTFLKSFFRRRRTGARSRPGLRWRTMRQTSRSGLRVMGLRSRSPRSSARSPWCSFSAISPAGRSDARVVTLRSCENDTRIGPRS